MAISLISGPQEYAPGYNPVVFVFDSTNKNNVGFKYELELRLADDTLVKSVTLNPRIGDGYAIFDVAKALQSYLTNQRPDDQNVDATDCYIGYKVRIRERFPIAWDFDRWDRLPFAQNDPLSGRIQLTGSTEHPYEVGDSINTSLDAPALPGFIIPGLNGPNIVHTVIDAFTIVLTLQSLANDPDVGENFSGTTNFNQKADTPAAWSTFDDYTVINAAWSVSDFPSYTQADVTLVPGNPNKDLLTNMPKEFTVAPDSYLLINIPYEGNAAPPFQIRFQRPDAETRSTVLTGGGASVIAIGAGPGNLPSSGWAGGSSFLTAGIQYSFWIENITNDRISNIYTINIDKSCAKYPTKQLTFLDRKGSLGSFYFKYLAVESADITRASATFANGSFVSPFYEGGKKALGVSVEGKLTLTTAWLTIESSLYFQELLSAPIAYLQEGSSYKKVIVTNTTSEKRVGLDNKNIRYTIDVELANNDTINW